MCNFKPFEFLPYFFNVETIVQCQLTREPLNLNGSNDEVVEGELPRPGVVFGQQILHESGREPISHLLEG